ncbi:MAG: FMN-binding glutamate synthase family protein [Candidatus Omnitrophica bacterium]|nr:FMN-binding glutamate synthase family protein [Candidatus Omnitrophota bacterium]MCM8802117.1 FMN-binding glutamate synthase family protein [Candidatus Omnitrophota bacterium]
MGYSRYNASGVNFTRNRIEPSPISGICVTCIDGCPGFCEIGKSAIRGRELIYPQPFGKITAGGEKNYPIDLSHFNIHGTCIGAYGIEADPDKAIFPNVDIQTDLGSNNDIKLRVPFFTGALGSTDIARNNWDHFAVGAAISGTIVIIGENVCGMDPKLELKNGKVYKSPDMEHRVKIYKEWYEGYGNILVQLNVEDTRLGVAEYVIEKLGVNAIELKWGQGAKDIGGEVKLSSIERAKQLKERGYIVLPDPDDPVVKEAYKIKAITEFERHSRLGMVTQDGFLKEVERLRKIGAKYITLKTGAYRPKDLAIALKLSSEAKIDLLTIDAAGGGTGMSPWRMMNEWGIPLVELISLTYKYCQILKEKGKYIPPIAFAGGLAFEDQIFKVFALSSPFTKAVCLGRATMTAGMVAKTIGEMIKKGNIPKDYKEHGNKIEQIFLKGEEILKKYGRERFKKIPIGAIGIYTYYDRLSTGLKQLMAGARKFALKYISRDDIFALTKEASEVSGIPFVMDSDKERVKEILD